MDLTLTHTDVADTGVVVYDSQHRLTPDYQRLLNEHPVLSAEEEHTLAVAYADHQDLQAAQTLVFSNLRGVVYVARNYSGYGLPLMDLVQEGTIGLMKAVKSFDPYQKVRLFAYALPWIKSEIQSYVVKNWKLVKAATTDARKKLFFNVRKLKQQLLPLGNSNEAIAKELNVPLHDVIEMDQYMHHTDTMVDDTLVVYDESTPESALIEKQNVAHQQLALSALHTLSEREQDIVQSRYLQEPGMTLQELAQKYNVSIERVRQLEKQALARLKTKLLT